MENALTTAAQALKNMRKRNPALTPVPPTTVDKKNRRTGTKRIYEERTTETDAQPSSVPSPMVKKKWSRRKIPKIVQKKEQDTAVFYLQLQNTTMKDKSIKAAMKRAGLEYSFDAEERIRVRVSRMKKNVVVKKKDDDSKLPLVLHKKMQNRIRLLPLPTELIEQIKQIEVQMQSKLEQGKGNDFVTIADTNLKHWVIKQKFEKLFGTGNRVVANAFKKNLQTFVTEEALATMGIEFKSIDMSILYTVNDSIIHQVPHFDYQPTVLTQQQIDDKEQFAWIMVLPVTNDGCWITVWTGFGVGTNMEIKYGECLFLRSDVVHAGGRPEIDNESDRKFIRLHCYLPTAFMKVDRDKIFPLDYNGAPLGDSYWVEDVPDVVPSSIGDA
jgi:hypothetical protein